MFAITKLVFIMGGCALLLSLSQTLVEDYAETLFISASPDGRYELTVQRINPGATEPFYIRVLRTDDDLSNVIYSVRGEEEAELKWLSDEVVCINGVELNIPAGETYKGDVHYPEAVQVDVTVQAQDVYGLEMEYAIGRVFLGGQSVVILRDHPA